MACLASCCPSPKSSSLRVVAAARCRLAKAPSPAQKPYCQHMAKSDGLLLTQNPLLASLPKEQLLTLYFLGVCLFDLYSPGLEPEILPILHPDFWDDRHVPHRL